jgi:transcriptional regulator with GAF, ATPase, and Fis domain
MGLREILIKESLTEEQIRASINRMGFNISSTDFYKSVNSKIEILKRDFEGQYTIKPIFIELLKKQLLTKLSVKLEQGVDLLVGEESELWKSIGSSKEIKSGMKEELELWKIIGISKEMKDVFKNIHTVLESDVPVVIHGETGTGKELVAKAIHYRGPRRKYPIPTINCAAISENLLESELLGHEKGAFAGATQQRIGKLELANMGSLFLDEISEMPLTIQSKILRVVENQIFERVGGNSAIKTNVRIISASSKDLLEEVRLKKFREDLYYRIAVFQIHVPPLRERKIDIPELVNCFVKRYSALSGKTIKEIDERAMDKLVNYNWPGNVRELENSIRRAILLTTSETLLPEHFDFPDLD